MSARMAGPVSVLGRVCLAAIFLMSALGEQIPQFNEVAGLMASEGVPAPKLMLAGAILFLIAGGVSLVLGYRARLGAGLLLVFLVLATYFFHDFWTIEDPAKQVPEMINFFKNVALMGAMLMVIANGSGAWSLDGRGERGVGTRGDQQ